MNRLTDEYITYTGGVAGEGVARAASASESPRHIRASMSAATISHGALIDGTDALRLILPLAAVVYPVANFVQPDAEAPAAIKEPLGCVAIRRQGCAIFCFCLSFEKERERENKQ